MAANLTALLSLMFLHFENEFSKAVSLSGAERSSSTQPTLKEGAKAHGLDPCFPIRPKVSFVETPPLCPSSGFAEKGRSKEEQQMGFHRLCLPHGLHCRVHSFTFSGNGRRWQRHLSLELCWGVCFMGSCLIFTVISDSSCPLFGSQTLESSLFPLNSVFNLAGYFAGPTSGEMQNPLHRYLLCQAPVTCHPNQSGASSLLSLLPL